MMMRYTAILSVFVYLLAVINAQETATVSASISVDDKNRDSHKRSANDKEPSSSPQLKTLSGFKPMIPNVFGFPSDSQYHPTAFHANTFAGKPQPILMITAASPHHHYASPSSYVQTPVPSNNFYSSLRNGLPQPQFYHHQHQQHQQQQHQHQFPYAMSPNHFAFSPIVATAAMSPIFHNHHPAMLAFQQHNMYHHPAPVNAFYANAQQYHKIPIYNQQPQTIPVASLISSFTSHHHPSPYSPSPANNLKQTPSHTKSVTLKASPQSTNANISPISPVPSFAASHVEHNEGAVSFAHFSTPTASSTGELKKELAAAPQRHQSHYNNHPQPILSPAYSRLVQYVPTSANNIPLNHHYSSQNDYANNVPSFSYAHLSKTLPSSSSNPHHSPGLVIGTAQRSSVSSTASPHQG